MKVFKNMTDGNCFMILFNIYPYLKGRIDIKSLHKFIWYNGKTDTIGKKKKKVSYIKFVLLKISKGL